MRGPSAARPLLFILTRGRYSVLAAGLISISNVQADSIVTVTGEIPAGEAGITLPHEHVLVDFIGAEKSHSGRWDRETVIRKALPYLKAAHTAGCRTFVDCTPNFLGRDALLLKELSEKSGLHIITNTGLYGGSDPKFLPGYAAHETERQLANRWVEEFRRGIGSTAVRPGFIKISVNSGPLSPTSQKLIRAAALAHLDTGLTIASHTGPGIPALEQIATLRELGVDPSAFIWVHAPINKDREKVLQAAKDGAWISFDGLKERNVPTYVATLSAMKTEGLLSRILVSHDAGYYRPGERDGGAFRPYTTLFDHLVPALRKAGFTSNDIDQLLRKNPAEAFSLRIRPAGT